MNARRRWAGASRRGRWRIAVAVAGWATTAWPRPAAAQPEPLLPVVDVFPTSGQAPLTVLVSGVRTTGKWGSVNDIDAWEWDLDFDGATFQPEASLLGNATVAFTYDRPGTHTVRLRVTDTPNQGGPREEITEVHIDVAAASHDPAERTTYPPNAWGAGIQEVWASPEELALAGDVVQPVDQAFMQWDQVEPDEHGTYDWSRLDGALDDAAAADHLVAVQINSRLPAWVFRTIAQTGTARGMPSPQFWDPTYIGYYDALIDALGAHLQSSPHQSRVLYVRQQWNAVHTETTHYDSTTNGDAMGTWVGNPNWIWPPDASPYQVEWSEDIALDYERHFHDKFLDTFRPQGIGVTLRSISSHRPLAEQNELYTSGDPSAWLLLTNGTYGKWDGGTQHTREFTVMRCYGALGFEETKNDVEHRIAEENPELSPEQDIYGVVLRALAVGLPYIGFYGSDLALAADNEEIRQAFEFGNKHAGWHRFPRSAPGAWLVLGRFEGSTDWRRLQTLAQDNWGSFLRQIDPANTSTAVALVGDPSARFGLTARRLDAPTRFDVDDGFAEIVAGEEVELRIVSQAGSGELTVQIDDGGTLTDLAVEQQTEHRGWQVATYRIAGATLTGGSDGETDLLLTPGSGAPVVHLLEIDRTGAAVVDPDGGTPPPDGGVGGGGGAAAAAGDAGDESGCGCRTGRPGPSAGTGWLALLLGLLVARRRADGLTGP